jgi:hypothetical protein
LQCTSRSHASAWECLSGDHQYCVFFNILPAVCVPTQERGNELFRR